MMTLNDNEKNFQKKLQKDTEIPVIVRERANQAYHHIENNTAVQKRETNDKNALRWMKTGGKVVAEQQQYWQQVFCSVRQIRSWQRISRWWEVFLKHYRIK